MTPLLKQLPDTKLTLKEEAALAAKIRKGDEKALNDLVMANMREAVVYTQKTSHGTIPEDDRVSMCYQRLVRAAKRFDPSWGKRFFAFAKAGLRGRMKRFWEEQNTVRNAAGIVSIDHLDHSPDPRGLVSDEDEEASDDTASCKIARLTGSFSEPEFENIFARDKWAMVQELVKGKLDSQQKMVLSLFYKSGLNGPEIGKLLGVSRSRIHAIHREAIQVIRNAIASSGRLLE